MVKSLMNLGIKVKNDVYNHNLIIPFLKKFYFLISLMRKVNDNIENHHVGWVRSLSMVENFSKVLQGIIDNNLEYYFDRQNIYNYALQVANTSKSIMANKQMFNNNE